MTSNNTQLKIKRLTSTAKLPTRGTTHSAGLDLYIDSIEVLDRSQIKYGFGLAIAIPEGHVGLIFPRSSICKVDMRLTNAVGVIDADYRGEISAVFDAFFPLSPDRHEPIGYVYGDRCAQLVVVPIPQVDIIEVDELDQTERGEGGYGSTGQK